FGSKTQLRRKGRGSARTGGAGDGGFFSAPAPDPSLSSRIRGAGPAVGGGDSALVVLSLKEERPPSKSNPADSAVGARGAGADFTAQTRQAIPAAAGTAAPTSTSGRRRANAQKRRARK